MKKKISLGRPTLSKEKTKEGHLEVRVRIDEKEAFKDAAELAGLPLSSWVRERLRRNARVELEEAGAKVAFLKNGGQQNVD